MPVDTNYEIHIGYSSAFLPHIDPWDIECLRPSKALAVSVVKNYSKLYEQELSKKLLECGEVAAAFAQLHNVGVTQKSLRLLTIVAGRNACICTVVKKVMIENIQLVKTLADCMYPTVTDPVIARGKTMKLVPCVEELATLDLVFEA